MQVLVATDGSQCSQRAITRTRLLFPNSAITVVAVVPIAAGLAGAGMLMAGPVVADNQLAEDLADAAITQAKELLAGVEQVTYTKAFGDPAVTIVTTAAETHSDLIVVGSHGRNLLERLLLGSVATHVVNHAACPVLVIRETDREKAAEQAT